MEDVRDHCIGSNTDFHDYCTEQNLIASSDVCVFSLVHDVEEARVDFRDYCREQKAIAVWVFLQVDNFSDDCI